MALNGQGFGKDWFLSTLEGKTLGRYIKRRAQFQSEAVLIGRPGAPKSPDVLEGLLFHKKPIDVSKPVEASLGPAPQPTIDPTSVSLGGRSSRDSA